MIELLTLLSGLLVGVHILEVEVAGPVAAVELRLDGRHLGTVDREPWTFRCDFGADLAPHRLALIARDASGQKLERLERWVNLAPAEPGDGAVTAVAVLLDEGVAEPSAADMRGWFLAAGETATVRSVETSAAEVVMVRDPGAQRGLEAMAERFETSWARRRSVPLAIADEQRRREAETPGWAEEGAEAALRALGPLGEGAGVRFLSPRAAPLSSTTLERQVFASSESSAGVGVLWLTRHVAAAQLPLRLSDAVAIAGREVHGHGGRRAVVLLLGPQAAEQSRFRPRQARAYLRRMQVPLFVWALGSAAPPEGWEEARPIGWDRRSPTWHAGFAAAVHELRHHLERQRVVLLEGRHLPQSITLGPAAEGVRLVGNAR